MEYRIVFSQTNKGYIVEALKYKWHLFGIKRKWQPCVFYRGTEEPYYFFSHDSALENLIKKIRFSVIENS